MTFEPEALQAPEPVKRHSYGRRCERCGALFGGHMALCPWWDEDHPDDDVEEIPPWARDWA